MTLKDIPDKYTEYDKFVKFFEDNPDLRLELLNHKDATSIYFLTTWTMLDIEAAKQLGLPKPYGAIRCITQDELRLQSSSFRVIHELNHQFKGGYDSWDQVIALMKDPDNERIRDEIFESIK